MAVEQRWINGCGLAGCNPDYIVGRTVAAQGYGKGQVEAYKRKKLATDVFVINFGTGGGRDIQELKLRRTYMPAGVDFRLYDNFNPAQPWKYGCDPAGLPERGWGEETKLTKPQVTAFQKLRGELSVRQHGAHPPFSASDVSVSLLSLSVVPLPPFFRFFFSNSNQGRCTCIFSQLQII